MPPPAQPASRRSSVFKSPEATAEESLLRSAAADVARVYSGSIHTTAECGGYDTRP